ncbi:PAAR domain-containing protein [Herbaspirillum rubrisubalbicans]|nr:PAAR domain-containing protein [Herbaspirillum rubrisubalbicans]
MPLPIIRLGDTTSHGGKVISASETHTIHGIGIARVGDMVSLTCSPRLVR